MTVTRRSLATVASQIITLNMYKDHPSIEVRIQAADVACCLLVIQIAITEHNQLTKSHLRFDFRLALLNSQTNADSHRAFPTLFVKAPMW